MKTTILKRTAAAVSAAVSSGVLLLAPAVSAATVTWHGHTDADVSNSANWVGGVAPLDGDSLTFPANMGNRTVEVDSTASDSFASIVFSGAANSVSSDSYYMDGLPITLSTDIQAIMTGAGGDHQVLNSVTLSNDVTFKTTGSNTLTVGDDGKTIALGSNDLTLDASGGSITLAGQITGSGKIVKSGTGKINLTATPGTGYTGTLEVSGGELVADSAFSGGNVTVAGGTLKGDGTVGSITMSSGAVAPGNSPGCLNSGALTYTGGSLNIEIAGTTECTQYDQQNVTGAVSLGTATTLIVSLTGGFSPTAGNTFTIIKNDGSDAVTGTFSGLAQGATVTVGAQRFTISYTGGDGNDVVLTAVAAPGTPDTGASPIARGGAILFISAIALASAYYFMVSAEKKAFKK